MKNLFSIIILLAAFSAQSQTPAFKRTGTNLPFVTTIVSNAVVLIDRGGGLAPANLTASDLMAHSVAPTDFDALAYCRVTGTSYRYRVNEAFKLLKTSGLWTNLVDGAALGSDLNLSGTSWATLLLRYGTNVGSPVVSPSGITFGGTQFAKLRGLPDMRTNTLLATFDNSATPGASVPAIALQNSASIDGLTAIVAHPSLAYMSLLRNNSSQLVSNQIAYWNGEGYTAVMPDEHTVSVSIGNSGRFATVDSYATGAVTSVGWNIAASLTSLNIGALLATDSDAPSANLWKGRMKQFLIFNRQLNTNELRTALRVMRWLDPREDNVVIVGDSLSTAYSDGYGSSGPTGNWPYKFLNSPALTNKFFFRNFSSGATHIQQWAAWYQDRCAIGQPGGPVRNSTLMYRLGANDLLNSMDLSVSIPLAQSFWTQAKSNGFRIEVLTCLRATNYLVSGTNQFTALSEANRRILNAAFTTNTLIDRVWKVDELFPDMTAGNGTSVDGVHLTGVAHEKTAQFLINGFVPENSAVELPSSFAAKSFSGEGASVTNVSSRLVNNVPAAAHVIDWAAADALTICTTNTALTLTTSNLNLFPSKFTTRTVFIYATNAISSILWPSWNSASVPTSMSSNTFAWVTLSMPAKASPTDGIVFASYVSGQFAYAAFDADATNYLTLNTYANSTSTMRNAVDTFVKTMKNAGVWSKYDGLWPMIGTNGTQQGLNLRATANFPITWVGSPTFSATGALMEGTTKYGNTTFNPTAASSPQYQTNSAHFFCYVSALSYSSNLFVMPYPGARLGYSDGVANSSFWKIDASYGGQFSANLNGGGLSVLTDGADNRGPMLVTRTNSANASVYLRSINPNAATATSTGIPNGHFYLGCENNGGPFANADSKMTLAGASIGGGITHAEWQTVRQAWDDLNNALGRQAP